MQASPRDMENGGQSQAPNDDYSTKEEEEEELEAFNTGPPQVGGKRVRHYGISFGSGKTELIKKLVGMPSRVSAFHQGVRVVGTMNEVYGFLIQLCLALHAYGAPAHRVEYSTSMVAHHFNIPATFVAIRTVILISFGRSDTGGAAQTHLFEVDQGLDCEKLYLVEDLCQQLADGNCSLTEGQQMLEKIQSQPPRFGDWIKILANGTCAAAIAPLFFKSGWVGVGVAFLLGLVTGVFLAIGDRSLRFARILELICAIVASFLARFINDFIYPICVPGVVLGAVVWLLPGLTLTVAMTELATKNLISGTVRFFYGLVITLELGMGIAIGSKMAFWEPQDDECEVLSHWYHLIWVPLFSISANILLTAHPKHWPAMCSSAAIAYVISFLTSKIANIGVESSSALSAMGLGLFANAYYYYLKSPTIIVMLAGVLLLVPGSIGVRGVTAFVGEKDAVSAITFTFQTIIITLSITVGIFIANLLTAPQPALVYKIILSE